MNHLSASQADVTPCSWAFLGFEPLRAAFEYISMQFMNQSELVRGDGHPVVIFPGLGTDRHSTAPLLSFCKSLGHEVHDWGRGFNTGPQGDADHWLDELARHVEGLASRSGASMSLIGWSLGGIYAREVAKRIPDRVRQVITIGTPLACPADPARAGWAHSLVNGQDPVLDDLARRVGVAPAAPTTSIYSRTDGIVAWQTCIQGGTRPTTENIEVDGSHWGLGWNPTVLSVVADRLSQPEGGWKRYQR